MECPACGRTIRNNTKFCQYCGTTLIKARPKQNIKKQPCPVCGASLKPGISFCTQCGTPVKRPGSKTGKNHSKRKNKMLPIVILFFLLLSGCLLFLISIKTGLISIKLPLLSERTTQFSQVDDGSSDRSELNDHVDAGATAPSDNSNDSLVSGGASNSEETASSNDVDSIEKLSSSIMRSRNTIDKEIELGKYTLSDFANNKLYSNHDVPVALFCPGEQGQDGYRRSYYYLEGELLFAEYAGNDVHQFYFNEGELIRWSYCPHPFIDSTITNYDNENTEPYLQWEEQILEESKELLRGTRDSSSGDYTNDYIISDSDRRYIDPSELVNLSRMEVRTAINELYARHGRKFTDKSIQSYFDSKSWYKPQIEPDDFSEEVFNDFETRNKEILVAWEIDHGWREEPAVSNP